MSDHKIRVSMQIPESIYEKLTDYAIKKGVMFEDIVKSCIKMGMIIYEIEDDPDVQLIYRDHGEDSEIVPSFSEEV